MLQAALLKIEQARPSGHEEAREAIGNIAAILRRFHFRSLSETRVKIP
jgi:hypothetical protein